MKKIITTSFLACASLLGFAQGSSISELGCGTVTSQEELKEIYEFVKQPMVAQKTTAVDTIPLTIHIVGDDNGKGYYKLDNLFKVICQLNSHYAPVNFYFSIKWPIHYINNTSYYQHDYNTGYAMMNSNNVSGTVNVYFVQDPAGNCGYYAPAGNAVAIGKSCANTNSTTLVHELGHYFGLPHTFSGWEGLTTATPPSNPEKVTRGVSANCGSAGDGFCDTDADYISNRWNCPYSGTYTDVNGDVYHPDGSLYMSYSNDACMNHFSPQQIARMQNRLNTSYRSLLNTPTTAYTSFAAPNIVYPVDKIYSNYTKVIWNKTPNAEAYHVKVKIGAANVRIDTVTTDTSVNIDFEMSEGYTYTVSVTPMNGSNVCGQVDQEKQVAYTNATTTLSVNNVAGKSGLTISPNPAQNVLNVQMNDFATGKYTMVMTNISGQPVYQQTINHAGGNTSNTISVSELPNGMYFIRVSGEGQLLTQKVIVQH